MTEWCSKSFGFSNSINGKVEHGGTVYHYITYADMVRGMTFNGTIVVSKPLSYHGRYINGIAQKACDLMSTGIFLFDIGGKSGHVQVFCGEVHDLSKEMARNCGLLEAIWVPRTYGSGLAKSVIAPLTIGLSLAMESLGRDHELVKFVELYLEACRSHPMAFIRLGSVTITTLRNNRGRM